MRRRICTIRDWYKSKNCYVRIKPKPMRDQSEANNLDTTTHTITPIVKHPLF
jgi:hypothetical protein